MNPEQIPSVLKLAFNAKLPVMMWGPPGVGKSSVIKQVAASYGNEEDGKLGRRVRDIRLALLDPTDLRGIPFYNPKTNTAEWAIASLLPQDENSTDIIFLDEINAAPPVIQAAAYQLVLDRAIGEYKLPDGVDIVAAGNRDTDKAVVFKMPTPLLNRFIHIDFEANFDNWYNWAIQNGINPNVIGFLKYKTNFLMKFDPKTVSRGFPTPRSWEFTSKILFEAEKMGMKEALVREIIKGTIGEGTAIEFFGHMKVAKNLPDPMGILDGSIKKLGGKVEMSARYSMIIALGQKLKTLHDAVEKQDSKKKEAFTKWSGYADNYFTFIHDNFDDEFCIMGVRDCFKNLKLPMAKTPLYRKTFVKKYGNMIMAA